MTVRCQDIQVKIQSGVMSIKTTRLKHGVEFEKDNVPAAAAASSRIKTQKLQIRLKFPVSSQEAADSSAPVGSGKTAARRT